MGWVVTAAVPWLDGAVRWMGVAFLVGYGVLRVFRCAAGGDNTAWSGDQHLSGVTRANRHVHLDTMALIGSVATRHGPQEAGFGAGAVREAVVGLTIGTIAAKVALD